MLKVLCGSHTDNGICSSSRRNFMNVMNDKVKERIIKSSYAVFGKKTDVKNAYVFVREFGQTISLFFLFLVIIYVLE